MLGPGSRLGELWNFFCSNHVKARGETGLDSLDSFTQSEEAVVEGERESEKLPLVLLSHKPEAYPQILFLFLFRPS